MIGQSLQFYKGQSEQAHWTIYIRKNNLMIIGFVFFNWLAVQLSDVFDFKIRSSTFAYVMKTHKQTNKINAADTSNLSKRETEKIRLKCFSIQCTATRPVVQGIFQKKTHWNYRGLHHY